MDWYPIQGGVEIFLVASCHRNRDKLRPDGPFGSYADFTLPYQLKAGTGHKMQTVSVVFSTSHC